MTDMYDAYREWDAAYVLGALSQADRALFEQHLDDCDDCRAAVAELAEMPAMLARLDANEVLTGEGGEPVSFTDAETAAFADADAETVGFAGGAGRNSGGNVGGNAPRGRGPRFPRSARRQHSPHRLRWTRGRIVTGAVLLAAAVAIVGTVGVTTVRNGQQSATGQTVANSSGTERYVMRAGDGSSMRVDLAITGKRWGTRFDWGCRYGTYGVGTSGTQSAPEYDLVLQRRDGTVVTVASWNASGADADGLAAVTDVPRERISAVEVRLHGSETVLVSTRI